MSEKEIIHNLSLETKLLEPEQSKEVLPDFEQQKTQELESTSLEKEFSTILEKMAKHTEIVASPDFQLDEGKIEGVLQFFESVEFLDLRDKAFDGLREKYYESVTALRRILLEKFKSVFESADSQEDHFRRKILKLLAFVGDSKDPYVAKEAGSLLLKHLDFLFVNGKIAKNYPFEICCMLTSLAGNREVVRGKQLDEKFLKFFRQGTIDLFEFAEITAMVATFGFTPEGKKFGRRIIKHILKKVQLPFSKIFKAWQSNAQPGEYDDKDKKEVYTEKQAAIDFGLVIIGNIMEIATVDGQKQGAAKRLYANYGINNFGRFKAKVWLAQEEEQEKQGPYGLIIQSRNDWNSRSYDKELQDTYHKLFRDIHSTHMLRIVEAGNVPELAGILWRLKRKYEQPPEFVIWAGHSSGRDFIMGRNLSRKRYRKNTLGPKDFEAESKARMQKYLQFFPPETLMIMDGCYEDTEDSLPKIAAKELGNKFIFPDGKTSVKDFGVERGNDGRLKFNVKYDFGVKTVEI